MNRIFLTVLTSAILYSITPPKVVASAASPDTPAPQEHQRGHPEKSSLEKTDAELIKECEDGMGKIKEAGASLPADLKTEFEYNLDIVSADVKALKNGNVKNQKKHANSCHRHLTSADLLLKKQEYLLTREKKMEERKVKMDERKARAEERKTKAAERKAKREAEKVAAHHDQKSQTKNKDESSPNGLDHGKTEGANKATPGS